MGFAAESREEGQGERKEGEGTSRQQPAEPETLTRQSQAL